jgi:hypothetical protein
VYEQVPIIRERTQNRLKVHHLIPDGGLDDLIPPTNHTLIDSRKNERLFKKMKPGTKDHWKFKCCCVQQNSIRPALPCSDNVPKRLNCKHK